MHGLKCDDFIEYGHILVGAGVVRGISAFVFNRQ